MTADRSNGVIEIAVGEAAIAHCRDVVRASRQTRTDSHVLHARCSESAKVFARLCATLGRPRPRLRLFAILGGAGALDGRRVVLVVDDPDARDLIGLLLKWHGAVVFAVADADADGFVLGHRADMILVDLPFDRTRVFALARRLSIQRDGNGASPRLVAFTKHAHDHRQSDALRAGFDAQIDGPLDPERFEQALVALFPAP
jgi:CheY-like chemotaxis protein